MCCQCVQDVSQTQNVERYYTLFKLIRVPDLMPCRSAVVLELKSAPADVAGWVVSIEGVKHKMTIGLKTI